MKVIVKVDKIRSYQTLVYKNGKYTYRKKEYAEYSNQITPQLIALPTFAKDKKVKLKIDFNFSKGKSIDIDNCVKIVQDILQKNGNLANDSQVYEVHSTKSFGNAEEHMVIELEEICR